MPDDWEKQYGLNPLYALDASQDKDSDGYSNLQEYRAGTNPTDPNSKPTKPKVQAMPWISLLLLDGEGNKLKTPSAPSNLQAIAQDTSIQLSWNDNSTNEFGFRIYRGTSSANVNTLIFTTGQNVTNHTDAGLSPVTTYYYRVGAYNLAGESAFSNTANATTGSGGGGALSSPTFTKVDFQNLSTVRLTWNDIEGEDEYKLEVSYDNSNFSEQATIPANETYIDVYQVPPCSKTYFRLRARNEQGYSDYSNIAVAETNTVATIQIIPGWTGSLKPGTYNIGCNVNTGNGGIGVFDDDGNGLVDLEVKGDQGYIWPRENFVDINCLGCAVQLKVGKKFYPGTNLALYFRHPDWALNPSGLGAFVSVFYNVYLQSGQWFYTPVGMTGGDLDYPFSTAYFPIVMYTRSGAPENLSPSSAYLNLPTQQQNGALSGAVAALISNTIEYTIYSAKVYILDMNVPVIVDDAN